MKEFRVAMVGLSWITSDPAESASHPALGVAPAHTHGSALTAIPQATVVAGCDINEEACQRFLERWSDVWPGVKTYTDYKQMFSEEEIDLAIVATPDNLHGSVVQAALESGIKTIFCEKPLTTHLDEADEMIAAINEHGAVVNVNHTRRWSPTHLAAREAVRAGEIGSLNLITVHLGGERAMLWRNHSHALDLICAYAESDPIWVVAELEPGFEDYGTRYKGDGGRDSALEPGVNAYIAFANGVRAFLGGMKQSTPKLKVELFGDHGSIQADDQLVEISRVTEGGMVSQAIVPRATMGGMQAGIVELMNATTGGGDLQCPPEEARKTVALIEAILESQAAGNQRIEVR
jgi:predicted dehydrogenase